MISKNVKRFVSGLLLSCNVMSFSGYAVDVLKEGNCGSSEGLKILYCTGRVFQESLAQNSVSATKNIRKKMIDIYDKKLETVKYKLTCIKRLKGFWNKFKAYLDISELSKVKNEFIELLKSDEHLVEYCMILDPIFTFPKEEKEIAEKAIISYIRAKLFSDNKYQFIVYSYLLDIMSKTNLKNISIKNISIKSYIEGYLFKNDLYKDEFIEWFEENQKVIFAPEKLIEEFSKMYNALYENINYILIDYVEFTKKSLSANIKDEKKLENTKEKVKKSAIKKNRRYCK